MRQRCEDGLAALGWLLDRRGIRDAFITLAPTGVNVTRVRDGQPLPTRHFRPNHLSRLADFARRQAGQPGPRPFHSPRESVLRLAGRMLDEERCHSAFIVVYDDLLLVDDDRYAVGAPDQATTRTVTATRASG